jgi:hypothetical protein
MPFTISHAAAVLPFARWLQRGKILSALVIGSMVPDFGFFLPWHLPRAETHSAAALLSFSLPVGLATYWFFQWFIKTAVREVLPDGPYRRAQVFAAVADFWSLKQWFLAAAGVLGGAVTHLVWDAFTHEGARGIRMIPAIDEWLLTVAGRQLQGTRLLQDLSSLVGLGVVAVVIWRALWTPKMQRQVLADRRLTARERHLWLYAYGLTAAAVSAVDLLLVRSSEPYGLGMTWTLGHAAIAAIRGVAAAVVGVSLCIDLRLRRGR